MTPRSVLWGVVLAGGLSSRMGELKPLLPIDDVAAVVRCAQAFTDIGVEPVVVLGFAAAESAFVARPPSTKRWSPARGGTRTWHLIDLLFGAPATCDPARVRHAGTPLPRRGVDRSLVVFVQSNREQAATSRRRRAGVAAHRSRTRATLAAVPVELLSSERGE